MTRSLKRTMPRDRQRYARAVFMTKILIISAALTGALCIGVNVESLAAPQAVKTSQTSTPASQAKSSLPKSSEAPLPTHKRGFLGTFFFWMGGVFCMCLVGRIIFKEQSHERRTLSRLRDELGHFFPEFDPVNITQWIHIAADHVFYAWREGDFDMMEGFSTDEFIMNQRARFKAVQSRKEKRSIYLDKVIAVHTLGMEWHTRDHVSHPPLGVSLTLRVETKAIDFYEDLEGTLLRGKKKPAQYQYIWRLTHNGNTWTISEIDIADGDITDLNQHPPLPPIADWRRPETSVEISAEDHDASSTDVPTSDAFRDDLDFEQS